MAYLRFDFETTAAAGISLADAVEAAFTPREWLVIRLARVDRIARHQASWPARLGRFIFGVTSDNPLADQRLETLREAASGLWKAGSGMLDGSLLDRLRDYGFSRGQLSLLSCWIAEHRR